MEKHEEIKGTEQTGENTIEKQAIDLLQLQYELRQLLFVRPFDIHAIESAAIKLCDAILDFSN